MWVLKYTGLDYQYLVKTSPYFVQILLFTLSDYYLYQLGKKVLGKSEARIAMYFLIFNAAYTRFMIRCFSNSFEAALQIIAFYFYYNVGKKFDINITMLAILLSVNLIVRPTSMVPWPVLLLVKLITTRAICSFLLTAIFVAIPALGMCIAIDSYMYG